MSASFASHRWVPNEQLRKEAQLESQRFNGHDQPKQKIK